jgi:hypothetical protein
MVVHPDPRARHLPVGGLLLLLNPFSGMRALASWQGVTLIVDGAQNLCIVIYTVKTGKRNPGGADLFKEE